MYLCIWLWLKIKQRGYAGVGPCFHFPGQPILELRVFLGPQPYVCVKTAPPRWVALFAASQASVGTTTWMAWGEGVGGGENLCKDRHPAWRALKSEFVFFKNPGLEHNDQFSRLMEVDRGPVQK